MKLFQLVALYPTYAASLDGRIDSTCRYSELVTQFLDDGYNSTHILKPILDREIGSFLGIAHRPALLRWARENGMPNTATDQEIVLAQIEDSQAEIIYDTHPGLLTDALPQSLPGCVKATICWHASPLRGLDLSRYDRVVCNFPGLLKQWQAVGARTEYFAPACDPYMDSLAGNTERPIDILFIGGYTRHHLKRARVLTEVASLGSQYKVQMHLDVGSRASRLAESPLGLLPPLNRFRRPSSIRKISNPPVFGREMYQTLSRSKVVVNSAIDMAGDDRGNIRCFETLACGALLLTDSGNYPTGMVDGKTLVTYETVEAVTPTLKQILGQWEAFRSIAVEGQKMVSQEYSKSRQWDQLLKIVSNIAETR